VKNPILSFPCTVHYTHIHNEEAQVHPTHTQAKQ
jgi:hypothetical protein